MDITRWKIAVRMKRKMTEMMRRKIKDIMRRKMAEMIGRKIAEIVRGKKADTMRGMEIAVKRESLLLIGKKWSKPSPMLTPRVKKMMMMWIMIRTIRSVGMTRIRT